MTVTKKKQNYNDHNTHTHALTHAHVVAHRGIALTLAHTDPVAQP